MRLAAACFPSLARRFTPCHPSAAGLHQARQTACRRFSVGRTAFPESTRRMTTYAPADADGGRKRLAYIALGSNIGDRFANIEMACRQMDARGIRVRRTSSLWETEPMYVVDQDKFINGACEVETDLDPLDLMYQLQDIENTMGREKVIDKGPRNIDLDILLYDNQKFVHEALKVPHIGIAEREFVLRPLAQLIPGAPVDPSRPWKFVQDYLNDLPRGRPIYPLTPISPHLDPLNTHDRKRRTHLMAILNITPDSFSDGGIHSPENLVETILQFARAGATIFDVGGQSTAPNAQEGSADEEAGRVLPIIRLLRKLPETKNKTISIDTYRASVAAQAVEAGADIINDVSAGALDPDMLPLMARLGQTVCLMHMRGTPKTMTRMTDYPKGVVPTVARELLQRIEAAEAAGVRRWRMVLDPGIGFAKTAPQNLEILRGLERLRIWPGLEGMPWLVGTSRKGFIGRITGVEDPRQRVFGTAATVAAAVQGGAEIVRVHDVAEMGQVVRMSDAIWRA